MYANDEQLYISCNITSIDRYVRILNKILHRTYKWDTVIDLYSKSKYLIIMKKPLKFDYHLVFFLNSQPIEFVMLHKIWGFNIRPCTNHINSDSSLFRNLAINAFEFTQLMPVLLYRCKLFATCDSISTFFTFNNKILLYMVQEDTIKFLYMEKNQWCGY